MADQWSFQVESLERNLERPEIGYESASSSATPELRRLQLGTSTSPLDSKYHNHSDTTTDLKPAQPFYQGLQPSHPPASAVHDSTTGHPQPHRSAQSFHPMGAGIDPVAKLVSTSIKPSPTHADPSSDGTHTMINTANPTDRTTAPTPSLGGFPMGRLSSSSTQSSTVPSAKVQTTIRFSSFNLPQKPSTKAGSSTEDLVPLHQQQRAEAAFRKAEVDRRHRNREEEKLKRQQAIEKQVQDGIAALRAEKQRDVEQLQSDRQKCKQWIRPPQANLKATSLPPGRDYHLDASLALGQQIRGLWETSRPDTSAMAQREEMIAQVQRAIDFKWRGKGLKVAAFGSSVTGLVTDSSDLDLVLLDPTRPYGYGTPDSLIYPRNEIPQSDMPNWYKIHRVADAIRSSGQFRNVVAISGASVPIVKMVFRRYGIPADINVNERFGLFNSWMVSRYAELQPQLFRPLVFFLKHWLTRRGLNDPSGKSGQMSFSSYTLVLMVIQYLQSEGLLPNLQDPALLRSFSVPISHLWSRPKKRRGELEARAPSTGYNVSFVTNRMEQYHHKALHDGMVAGYPSEVDAFDQQLGRLAIGFLHYYANFPRHRQILSIANGRPLDRKRWNTDTWSYDSADDSRSESISDSAGLAMESQAPDRPTGYARHAIGSDIGKIMSMQNFREPDDWEADEIVVQDPFIVDRNTARNIKGNVVERWEGELERALLVLNLPRGNDEQRSWRRSSFDTPLISDLCAPTTIVPPVPSRGPSAHLSAMKSTSYDSPHSILGEPWRFEEEEEQRKREELRIAAKLLKSQRRRKNRNRNREGDPNARRDAAGDRTHHRFVASASDSATTTNGDESSEDLDLVALRLRRRTQDT